MKTQDVKASVEKAAEVVKEEFANAKKTVAKAGEKAEKYVEQNPKKSMAIFAGAGAVFGVILGAILGKKKK